MDQKEGLPVHQGNALMADPGKPKNLILETLTEMGAVGSDTHWC